MLPSCQDTGTAIVKGKKGELVLTGGGDREAIARGIFRTYTEDNLRYSQMAPLTMYDEKNTGTNLPAEIEIEAVDGDAYKLLFMAKGGGSANKSLLFQETKALLNPSSLMTWLDEKLRTLGTAACPPYHLALVIGGTSAEIDVEDREARVGALPRLAADDGQRARAAASATSSSRTRCWSSRRQFGIGAQFGGKYFCHDVRVIRLPRHGASCPVALAVSCSADRQALGKITADGVFLEQLETDPAKYLPESPTTISKATRSSSIDLDRPMAEIRATLSRYPVKTRVMLNGPDGRRARHRARQDQGAARRAARACRSTSRTTACTTRARRRHRTGYASGSFGPTTAGRMDSYVDLFQRHGGSLRDARQGQPVARPSPTRARSTAASISARSAVPPRGSRQDCITKVEVLEYPELGMEAVWKIEVRDFPAFIVVDDKGNDFFSEVSAPLRAPTTRA